MRSRNGRYADLMIADANFYQPISASFVAHQRIVSERLGCLGFSGLSYITPAGPVDIVEAGRIGNVMPATTLSGLCTEGLLFLVVTVKALQPCQRGKGSRTKKE